MVKTILIVDDEPSVLEVVGNLVRNEGYEVEVAGSGEDALNLLTHREFDLILTDLMMPGITGWQVLEVAKQKYPGIKVIVFTGFVDEEGEAILIDRKADGFLTKPIDVPLMQSLLTSLLLGDDVIGASVVAVDDDRFTLKMVERILTENGMSVNAFESPAEALAHALNDPPHLFLIDLEMPKVSGFDLCREIREDAKLSGIPVIILTSHAERSIVARAMEMDIQGFLIKPFEPDTLIEKAKKVIISSRPAQ